MKYSDVIFKIPRESESCQSDSQFVIMAIESIIKYSIDNEHFQSLRAVYSGFYLS